MGAFGLLFLSWWGFLFLGFFYLEGEDLVGLFCEDWPFVGVRWFVVLFLFLTSNFSCYYFILIIVYLFPQQKSINFSNSRHIENLLHFASLNFDNNSILRKTVHIGICRIVHQETLAIIEITSNNTITICCFDWLNFTIFRRRDRRDMRW